MKKFKFLKVLLIINLIVIITISGIDINSYADYLEAKQQEINAVQLIDTNPSPTQNEIEDNKEEEKEDTVKYNDNEEDTNDDLINDDKIINEETNEEEKIIDEDISHKDEEEINDIEEDIIENDKDNAVESSKNNNSQQQDEKEIITDNKEDGELNDNGEEQELDDNDEEDEENIEEQGNSQNEKSSDDILDEDKKIDNNIENMIDDNEEGMKTVIINNIDGKTTILGYSESMIYDFQSSIKSDITLPINTEITLEVAQENNESEYIFDYWRVQTHSGEELTILEKTITFRIQEYSLIVPCYSKKLQSEKELRVEIYGDTEINIPVEECITTSYIAKVYDNDQEIENEIVKWSIDKVLDGVEIKEDTGILTVTNEANDCELIITGKTRSGFEDSLIINLVTQKIFPAPNLIADDENNIIIGSDSHAKNMEYYLNNDNDWIIYDPSAPPDLTLDVVISIRFIGTKTQPPSKKVQLEFNNNYEDNFNKEVKEYPYLVNEKRGYLSVKHYDISAESILDEKNRYKMFGRVKYDGFIMQEPKEISVNDSLDIYDESEETSLYFQDQSNDSFGKVIIMWGYFVPEKTGYYQLYTYNNDGIYGSLTINDIENVFVNQWNYQTPELRGNDEIYYLEEGKIYPLYINYFEQVDNITAFKLQMSFNENMIEDVPESYLYPSSEDLTYHKKIPVDGINMELDHQIININETNNILLNANITPIDATNKKINWSSSDENIAEVDVNGNVSLHSIGSVEITAITEDGNYKDCCILEVVSEQNGDQDDFFYIIDNTGKLVKYYPYSANKIDIKEHIGKYKDIATLPDGSLVGITKNGYLYKNIELGNEYRVDITPDGGFIRGYFYNVNTITCDNNGDLYFLKENSFLKGYSLKKYDINNKEIIDVIDTIFSLRGNIVFSDSNTLYYIAYDKQHTYLMKVDLATKEIENICTVKNSSCGIAIIDNKLFVTYTKNKKSYVDRYNLFGKKLNNNNEEIPDMQSIYGTARGIPKKAIELVGPYDYDYFYLNDIDGKIKRYYPDRNKVEDVCNTKIKYYDIANNNGDIVGISQGNLYKNITTNPVVIKKFNDELINSLTYNNGLYYLIKGNYLYSYNPENDQLTTIVKVVNISQGDVVVFHGDIYYLAETYFNHTKLMKIDFDDNMKISKVSHYSKNMMGIAVAKNTLFVSYENKIAKVNLLNGKLYDEFQIESLNTIYGAAQGGYITPIVTTISINGPNDIDVPTKNSSPQKTDYKAIIKDQFGHIIDNAKVSWSLKKVVNGVEINESTGELTITNKANSGSITIVAECDTIEQEKEITINKAQSQISNIEIIGRDTVDVPLQNTPYNIYTYDVKMEDQYGNSIDYNDIIWSLQATVDGISIDSEGKLKVTSEAPYSLITIEVKVNSIKSNKTIKLDKIPPIKINDELNILQGADETMEYSIDGGTTWNDYNNELSFPGKVIVQIRYRETELLTASEITEVIFTKNTPEAPNVSGNDEENTLQGADETMEYSIDDGTTWNDYNNDLIFQGKVTVQLRYKETKLLTASKVVKVEFTKNTPEAPNVSGNDEANTLQGADETMEYSIDDGTTWNDYNNDLIFQGKVTVQLRYKETELLTASKVVKVEFTKNTPEAPNVSGNDEANTLQGADDTMEYSIDGGTTWNDYNNDLIFQGKVTVQLRYKETELLTASEITEVIFTKNTPEAPNISGNDEENTLQGADETMEYSIDNGTTWNDYNNELTFSGKVIVQIRYKETELLEASIITEVEFTKNTQEAPNVSGNDEENTLKGADETMEYSIDGGTTWNDYNNDLIFQGKVTVQLRYKETELLTASEITEVIFTKNTPEAPNVSSNDEENTLQGADETMEYSIDGGTTWNDYNNELSFPGKVTVQLRYKETELLTASEVVKVEFTKNTPEAPNVSSNDKYNTLQGADDTMEYSFNGGSTWYTYRDGKEFPGNETVQVRYKETELLTASKITEVIFTKNSSSSGGNHKKPSKENDKNHNKPSKKDETDLEDELIIEEPLTPLGAIEYYEPYIKGFPDGSFKPSKSVTRAEVATMFARILNLDTKDTNNCKYVDVSSDYWAKKYITAVTDIGLFTGDTDNTFRPNEPIKRYEIAIVFSRYWDYVGVKVKDSKSIFKDTSGHWAESYINKLYNAGVVKGFSDKTFRPDTDTVREQIVVMINKIIARPSLETEEPLFADVINEHWAFGDIQAASVKFNKKESEEKTEK